ncbi:MAG: hypothetical protein WDZ49_15295 [Litorilinea sp.]
MRNVVIAVIFLVVITVAAGLGWMAWRTAAPDDLALVGGDEISVQDLAAATPPAGEEETDTADEVAADTEADTGADPDAEADVAESALARLREEVAFVYNWNTRLGIWRNGEDVSLGSVDASPSPRLASAGDLIAFARDGGLWVMGIDGEQERLLVSQSEIEGMGNADTTARLHRIAWLPGTSRLLFNTALNLEMGLALSNDLHMVDVDTLDLTEILPAGAGGEFYAAPDGATIAVIAPDRIRFVDPLGVAQRPAFLFPPVVTYSEYIYYPQVVWAQDSRAVAVVIPHPEAVVQPEQPASIYRLAAGADETTMLGQIQAGSPTYWIDPTLQHVAYTQIDFPDADPGAEAGAEAGAEGAVPAPPTVSIVAAQLDGTPLGTLYEGGGQFVGWSPTGEHFALATPDGAESMQIGSLGQETLTPLAGLSHAFSHQVAWVDTEHFVVVVADAAATTVALGNVQGELEALMQVEAGSFTLDMAAR